MNLFIFRRDLRIIDNTSLISQIKKYGKVIPAFIFTPQQIDKTKNKYFSSNSVQFMIQSLKQLNQQICQYSNNINKNLKLNFFYGQNLEVLNQIQQKYKINSIAFNKDYTPYAKNRDKSIIQWAKDKNIDIITLQDYTLYNLTEINFMGKNNTPPAFTPFKLYCYQNQKVRKVDDFKDFQFQQQEGIQQIKSYFDFNKNSSKLYEHNSNLAVHGGRKSALKILQNFPNFTNYFSDRNYPALPATKLSAYLHFTNISIRQVYQRTIQNFGIQHHLIFQLHARDFFTYITQKFPQVLLEQHTKNLKKQFNQIKWQQNYQQNLQKWKKGQTGIPFIDAGMRQMNITGYMHNRTRQNVACFLVKDLFIDWRQGQKYFAQKLVDYSPTQNSGNWQYVAGVGTDPRDVRIFNPWLQAEKYDHECQYIKKWIPQLKQVSAKDILKWQNTCQSYLEKGIKYYQPIVRHEQAVKHTQKVYNNILKQKKQVEKDKKEYKKPFKPKYVQKI